MSSHEPPVTGEKYCPRCEKTKHVLAFGADPRMKDGLRSVCRDCTNRSNHEGRSRKSKKRTIHNSMPCTGSLK